MALTYHRCPNCGFRGHYAFYNPESIYCEGCDEKVGETYVPVESGFAALKGDKVIDSDSGETLAQVEWFID